MTDCARWLHTEMQNELMARKNALLNERGVLARAQTRMLEIDEAIEKIDAELAMRAQEIAKLPPQEVSRAEPAA